MKIDKLEFKEIQSFAALNVRPIDMIYGILFGQQVTVGGLTITRFTDRTMRDVQREISTVIDDIEEDRLLWNDEKSEDVIRNVSMSMLQLRKRVRNEQYDSENLTNAAGWLYRRHVKFQSEDNEMYAFEMDPLTAINTQYDGRIELLTKPQAERRLSFYLMMYRHGFRVVDETTGEDIPEDVDFQSGGIQLQTIKYKLS